MRNNAAWSQFILGNYFNFNCLWARCVWAGISIAFSYWFQHIFFIDILIRSSLQIRVSRHLWTVMCVCVEKFFFARTRDVDFFYVCFFENTCAWFMANIVSRLRQLYTLVRAHYELINILLLICSTTRVSCVVRAYALSYQFETVVSFANVRAVICFIYSSLG